MLILIFFSDAVSDANMLTHAARCCFGSQHADSRGKMLFRKQTCWLTRQDAVSEANMLTHATRCCFESKHAASREKFNIPFPVL